MPAKGQGPEDLLSNGGQEEEFEPEFFNFTDLSRRTKNMHQPKLALEIGSYFGLLSALAGDIAAKVATDALGVESDAALFNVARLKPGSKDLVAFPTKEKGPASIVASWPDKSPNGRLDLQYLLQAYPVRIPKGHRAFVPVQRHDSAKFGPGILFKFSEISYARITTRPKSAEPKPEGTKKDKKPAPPPPDGNKGEKQGA